MAMTHDEAFLQTIIENPDDDAPRLVYADWLEERGDPRGEFIRVQCALARMGGGDSRCPELQYQEQQLLGAHRAEWLGPLPQGAILYEPIFRRGFLEEVSLGPRTFLELGEQLFRLHPLRRLSFLGPDEEHHFAALAASPLLARLTALCIRGINDRGAEVLAASPHLTRLTALDLSQGRLGPGGARALASSPALKQLNSLSLYANVIGPQGAEALATSPYLARLTCLDLGGLSCRYGDVENNIGDRGAEALAASPYLTRLAKLTLYLNLLGDAGVRALAASPTLANLVDLKLHGNYLITDDGVEALAASPHLTRLKTLWLGGVGARGARALAASPSLAGLWDLNASVSSTDEEARQVLRARFGNRVAC
jgi:uncharacterized protein (TIGR02996 family)